MPQHTSCSPIDRLTTTAPGTTNAASKREPISVVESSYNPTTKRWYRKYSDGWIEQGGYYGVTGTWSNYDAFDVTFDDYPFTQAPVMIHCVQASSGSGSGYQGLYGVSNVSATGFTYNTGYTANANSSGFYWTAKGI